MKLNLLLTLGCFSASTIGIVTAESDAVRQAIERFEKSRREKKPAEVAVVLDPPAEVPLAVPVGEPPLAPTPEPEQPTPSLPEPTSPPAESIKPSDQPPLPPASTADPAPASSPMEIPNPIPTQKGVALSVDQLSSGQGTLDTASLRIHAPFPAKPLAQAPPGWRIIPSHDITPFSEKVELEKGKTITLSIKPHVLVPDTDGFLSFSVPEPGFAPSLEYHQNATIGAVLSKSLMELDEDSKQLGSALDQLEQILFSLPQPKAKAIIVEDEARTPEPNPTSSQ